jgi:6-phosphogluconate dehydrogenase
VSGGEEGALKGPSIMPGGQRDAYDLVAPILTEIAAKAPDGEPCVAYMGSDGAGHFVKMVHNGIEYGDMQLIAESYAVLKQVVGLSNEELGKVYTEWNQGELDSYLIEITSKIFSKKDEETGKDLVDVILDRAAQKGTGKWTSQNALDLGAPLPLITEAVFARVLSSLKDQRVAASKVLEGPGGQAARRRARRVHRIGAPCAVLQQGDLVRARLRATAGGVGRVQVGSRLRHDSQDFPRRLYHSAPAYLQKITDAYTKDKAIANLLLDPYFRDIAKNYQSALREVVIAAINAGVPVPAFASAVAYFDAYRSERLPANLVQAQRDFFGAHTFERTDKPGSFHANWS